MNCIYCGKEIEQIFSCCNICDKMKLNIYSKEEWVNHAIRVLKFQGFGVVIVDPVKAYCNPKNQGKRLTASD